MRKLLAAAPALLVLTACIGDGLGNVDNLGFVFVRSFNNSGTPVLRASAVFYETTGIDLEPATPAACFVDQYSPQTSGDNAGVTMNAGANVSFTVGAFTEAALPTPGATFPIYNFAQGTYLDFASGDSVLANIPGAPGGFPAMSVKGRLAEPFAASPLPSYVPNMPMDVTWEAATTPGSIMLVSLRFNDTPGASSPDLEVACAFADDGSGQIPANLVGAYGSAEPQTQQYAFIRIRDRIVEFDSRTRARVRSIFEYPAVSLVNAP